MKKKYTREQILNIMNQPADKKRTISDEDMEKLKRQYNALYNDYEDKVDISKKQGGKYEI